MSEIISKPIYTLISNNTHEGRINQPSSLRISFHITDACNMACKYCYEHKSKRVINPQYARDLIDEVMNLLAHQDESFLFGYLNCETDSEIQLDFIGGEVTLYMDLIDEIVNYFCIRCQYFGFDELLSKFKIILETNGTTYFNDDVQRFLAKWGERVEYPVTIDGCRDCHNYNRVYNNGQPTFDDVDLAVKDYIAHYGIPDTKMTFTNNTLKYILYSCKYLYSLGYKTCRMNTDITKKLSIEETQEYYNALIDVADWIIDNQIEFLPSCFSINYIDKKIYGVCGMLGNQIAIDMDGNLFNCFRMAEPSMGDLYKPIGSIVTRTIDFDFVNEFLDNINTRCNPKCYGCPIQFGCEECPADNKLHNGSWYSSWNNCGQTVAQAKAQKYFLQRVVETDYPYFKEELAKIQNMYDPNFNYLIYQENTEQ